MQIRTRPLLHDDGGGGGIRTDGQGPPPSPHSTISRTSVITTGVFRIVADSYFSLSLLVVVTVVAGTARRSTKPRNVTHNVQCIYPIPLQRHLSWIWLMSKKKIPCKTASTWNKRYSQQENSSETIISEEKDNPGTFHHY